MATIVSLDDLNAWLEAEPKVARGKRESTIEREANIAKLLDDSNIAALNVTDECEKFAAEDGTPQKVSSVFAAYKRLIKSGGHGTTLSAQVLASGRVVVRRLTAEGMIQSDAETASESPEAPESPEA